LTAEAGAVRIAIFDYHVLPTNPVGGCHRRILQALCHEHEFTVFAVAFDNPCPERIAWVRVPAPSRPLFLLFLIFYSLAPLLLWLHSVRTKRRFDLIQVVESYVAGGTVAYSHFCHRAYLGAAWGQSGATGMRGLVRWLDHSIRALVEPRTYRRINRVVVPSRGLAKELEREYPFVRTKIHIIPNPVDTQRLKRPPTFDATTFRRGLGLAPDDIVLIFVALGHFERKGLPLLLASLQRIQRPDVKLLIVGGRADLIRHYKKTINASGLRERIIFAGQQRDTRPYLWASDAFVFPSSYEVFSLVSFEAAAAGLPLIASSVYGVEEFLRDGINGLVIERSTNGILQGIDRLLAMTADERRALGARASQDVQHYGHSTFVEAWRAYYRRLANQNERGAVSEPSGARWPWQPGRDPGIRGDHVGPQN
jgi:glycosyltransferase involved in cell wall biosynthesis